MWIITTRGFYSVVQKPNDPPTQLTVRARNEEDIRNLADLLPNSKPFASKGTDYEWRLHCTVAEWSKAMALLALEVDYGNFKNEVRRKQGTKREAVYHSLWSVLLRLERKGRYGNSSWSGDWPELKPAKSTTPKAGTSRKPTKKADRNRLARLNADARSHGHTLAMEREAREISERLDQEPPAWSVAVTNAKRGSRRS